jgi:hypothetical protein
MYKRARSIRGGRQPPSAGARIALERISRIIEANPGPDARTIRVRTGFSRERGDAVLARLLRDGFIELAQPTPTCVREERTGESSASSPPS